MIRINIEPDYFKKEENKNHFINIMENLEYFWIDVNVLTDKDLDLLYCTLICLEFSKISNIPAAYILDKLGNPVKRWKILKLLKGHITFMKDIMNYPYLFEL